MCRRISRFFVLKRVIEPWTNSGLKFQDKTTYKFDIIVVKLCEKLIFFGLKNMKTLARVIKMGFLVFFTKIDFMTKKPIFTDMASISRFLIEKPIFNTRKTVRNFTISFFYSLRRTFFTMGEKNFTPHIGVYGLWKYTIPRGQLMQL